MDITKIDKNFSAKPVDENGCLYRDVKLAPFVIEGLPWFEQNRRQYYRIPKKITKKDVNEGVLSLSNHTSGVCVRFRSDSEVIVARAKLAYSSDMNHMPRTGSAGFDLYCKPLNGDLTYCGTVQPAPRQVEIKAQPGSNPQKQLCDWILNFPLYGGVSEVEIGLKKGSVILPPTPHKVKKPILFYGSSITQGGCASRPGNQYTSMLCRELNAEQINLGFSGSARGELAMAKLIASLDLAAFVYDYDHNAPDPEHLRKTHEPFFRLIRKAQPKLPIIILSKGDHSGLPETDERFQIICTTYQHAIEAGDTHVYLIDGKILFGKKMRDACTVDGCHPNDLGFYRMYKNILPVLKKALKEAKR